MNDMKNCYILGVDGGNSKTDFYLFRTDGVLCGHLRTGTCSHEALGSYENAFAAMQQALNTLYSQCGIGPAQMESAVFGLAGVDIPSQKANMEQVVSALGFPDFLVCNDGFLGVKAAAGRGVGVCSICGTGTVTAGVDETGRSFQVGGIGAITLDHAGGAFLARQALSTAYAQRCRNGIPFAMTEWIEEKLQVKNQDQWLEKLHPDNLDVRPYMTDLIQRLMGYARQGDPASCEIVKQAGEALADGVLGCMANLNFSDCVEVVLAGSVWVKGGSQLMMDAFLQRIFHTATLPVTLTMLQVPPVLGAVYWAWERACGAWIDEKTAYKIRSAIEQKNS